MSEYDYEECEPMKLYDEIDLRDAIRFNTIMCMTIGFVTGAASTIVFLAWLGG